LSREIVYFTINFSHCPVNKNPKPMDSNDKFEPFQQFAVITQGRKRDLIPEGDNIILVPVNLETYGAISLPDQLQKPFIWKLVATGPDCKDHIKESIGRHCIIEPVYSQVYGWDDILTGQGPMAGTSARNIITWVEDHVEPIIPGRA
jgi:hypothetical protein